MSQQQFVVTIVFFHPSAISSGGRLQETINIINFFMYSTACQTEVQTLQSILFLGVMSFVSYNKLSKPKWEAKFNIKASILSRDWAALHRDTAHN